MGSLYVCSVGGVERLHSARSAVKDYDELNVAADDSFQTITPPVDLIERALALQERPRCTIGWGSFTWTPTGLGPVDVGAVGNDETLASSCLWVAGQKLADLFSYRSILLFRQGGDEARGRHELHDSLSVGDVLVGEIASDERREERAGLQRASPHP